MPTLTWVSKLLDDFQRDNTAPGNPGNNWIDGSTNHNVWQTAGQRLSGIWDGTATPYKTNLCLRPTAENALNQRVITRTNADSVVGLFWTSYLRYYSAPSLNFYFDQLRAGPPNGTYSIFRFTNGNSLATLATMSWTGFDDTHLYEKEFYAVGANPTTLYGKVTDTTLGVVVATLGPLLDYGDANLRQAGQCGVGLNATVQAAVTYQHFESFVDITLTPTPVSTPTNTTNVDIAIIGENVDFVANPPTFLVANGATKVSQSVQDATHATVRINAGAAGSYATITETVTGASCEVVITIGNATGAMATGPASGPVGQPSAPFGVDGSPLYTVFTAPATFTPSDNGAGGTFLPASVTLSTGAHHLEFTYTPAIINPAIQITFTNDAGLANPNPLVYDSTPPTLVPPVVSTAPGGSDQRHINLVWTPASGGIGPYAYAVHREETSGFVPGLGTLLANVGAALSYADAAPDPTKTYIYKIVVSDSGTGSNHQSATSVQHVAQLWLPPLPAIGFLGDSLTALKRGDALQTTADYMAMLLRCLPGGQRALSIVNEAIGGTSTRDWLVTGTNYLAAKAAFLAAGVKYVWITLGANDCTADGGAGLTDTEFYNNLLPMLQDLVASGMIPVLNFTTYRQIGFSLATEANQQRLRDYQAKILLLVNGKTILLGDTANYVQMAEHPDEQVDGLHPNNSGAIAMALNWALRFAQIVGLVSVVPVTPLVSTAPKGVFTAKRGDTLPPLVYQLLDAFGAPIPLGGKTVIFHMKQAGTNTKPIKVNAPVTIVDAVKGWVRYDWQTADVDTAGSFSGEFEVQGGGLQTTPVNANLLLNFVPDLA